MIDPFLGVGRSAGCGGALAPIWKAELARQLRYRPVEIYNAGISNYRPDPKSIRNGTFIPWLTGLPDETVYVWADVFGVEVGDSFVFTLRSEDGKLVFKHRRTAPKRGSRAFLSAGSKVPGAGRLRRGLRGMVTVERKSPDGIHTDRMTVRPKDR